MPSVRVDWAVVTGSGEFEHGATKTDYDGRADQSFRPTSTGKTQVVAPTEGLAGPPVIFTAYISSQDLAVIPFGQMKGCDDFTTFMGPQIISGRCHRRTRLRRLGAAGLSRPKFSAVRPLWRRPVR